MPWSRPAPTSRSRTARADRARPCPRARLPGHDQHSASGHRPRNGRPRGEDALATSRCARGHRGMPFDRRCRRKPRTVSHPPDQLFVPSPLAVRSTSWAGWSRRSVHVARSQMIVENARRRLNHRWQGHQQRPSRTANAAGRQAANYAIGPTPIPTPATIPTLHADRVRVERALRDDDAAAGHGANGSRTIAYAKANPGKLNFGMPNGAPPHMLAAWFRRRDQNRHRDRALSRRLARADRHDRRPDRSRLRDHLGHLRACPRRQGARARRHPHARLPNFPMFRP